MNEHATEALIAENTAARSNGEFLRGIGALALLVAVVFGYSWAVAYLWNVLFPGFNLSPVQALGVVVLVLMVNAPGLLLVRLRR